MHPCSLFFSANLLDRVNVYRVTDRKSQRFERSLPASLTGQVHENGENVHDTFLSPLHLIDYTFADWHVRLVSSQKIVQLLISYLFVHNSYSRLDGNNLLGKP